MSEAKRGVGAMSKAGVVGEAVSEAGVVGEAMSEAGVVGEAGAVNEARNEAEEPESLGCALKVMPNLSWGMTIRWVLSS